MTAQSAGPNSHTVAPPFTISALFVMSLSERHQTLPSREDVMEPQFRQAELAASPVQLACEVYMIGGNEKYPPSQQYSSGIPKIACAVS